MSIQWDPSSNTWSRMPVNTTPTSCSTQEVNWITDAPERIANRKGYQKDYSIRDAAKTLWREEHLSFNLKDLDDPVKSKEILENLRQQARWDLGIDSKESEDAVLDEYIQGLRQNGVSGEVNWGGLEREFDFYEASPEDLSDRLDYLASRYVATLDKLERNFTGDELAAQCAKLEDSFQKGQSSLLDSYTELLHDNLGLSDSDAKEIQDSFSTLLDERVKTYQDAVKGVQENVAKSGPDSVWLKDHDAYIAKQLRTAATTAKNSSQAKYSIQDLQAAGRVAQDYRSEKDSAAFSNRNEAKLALNLSMVDMKAETVIQKGLVSKNMASLLRRSRDQAHQNVLAVLDQALAEREKSRLSGEPKGTFAPVNQEVFDTIYNAVMNAYKQNGGNGAEAIRAGVTTGKSATAKAAAKNPHTLRWGMSAQSYWEGFYGTPQRKALSGLDKQIDKVLAQLGQTSERGISTYQTYVNRWQNFVASIVGGFEARG